MKKDMFKISTVLSVAFLAMFLTTLIPPVVKAWYGEYTIQPMPGGAGVWASRCDHLVSPPSTEDAWTGCGIAAYYDDPPDRYVAADYYFQRGYGAYIPYDYNWITDSPMYCMYGVDRSFDIFWGLYRDYNVPSWGYGEWPAYYQNWQINVNPISVYFQRRTVGAQSSSYFKEVNNPNNRIYISSLISPNDMYAANPNWREE